MFNKKFELTYDELMSLCELIEAENYDLVKVIFNNIDIKYIPILSLINKIYNFTRWYPSMAMMFALHHDVNPSIKDLYIKMYKFCMNKLLNKKLKTSNCNYLS